MAKQIWITYKQKVLAGVSRGLLREKAIGVLLVAGYSQPMADTDYFMSKLAQRLSDNRMYVVQIDPAGHGDSSGDLEDSCLESLRDDFRIALQYLATNTKTIYGVGRGLNATVLAEAAADFSKVAGVAGVVPYCVAGAEVSRLWPGLEPEVSEWTDVIRGSDYVDLSDFVPDQIGFVNALGALVYNLHGQKTRNRFLAGLSQYQPLDILRRYRQNSLWLFPVEADPVSVESRDVPEVGLTLEQYWNLSLPRNPMWQHNAIERLKDWIVGREANLPNG